MLYSPLEQFEASVYTFYSKSLVTGNSVGSGLFGLDVLEWLGLTNTAIPSYDVKLALIPAVFLLVVIFKLLGTASAATILAYGLYLFFAVMAAGNLVGETGVNYSWSWNLSVIDNFLYLFGAMLFFVLLQWKVFYLENSNGRLIPTRYQYVLENFYKFALDLFSSTLEKSKKSESFFPIIFTLFIYLFYTNVQGMVPYSFTITSHLINTFYLALSIFALIVICVIRDNGWKGFFALFMPEGSPLALAPLLVPIEVISYVFRVLSLSIRLFANMMAGHILLKVILGFSWAMTFGGEWLCLASALPILVLCVLTLLEFGVAMIQSYIFCILLCIYLKDIFFAH